ncbi:MAG: hypothetical protein HYY11_06290 [Candidatus Methylomirabilis oxyfera]|nr:hypothetical protein [Candidatus Methylomirabilis oxyfera]
MKANRVVRHMLSALLGLVLAAALLPLSPAWANGNESQDLVAPYGHFDMVAGSASGPLTTHYLISNTDSGSFISPPGSATVNVKCFNDTIQRVGPPAGTNIVLAPFAMAVHSPVSLGLTSDGAFTGLGFCYFAVTAGGDIAVSFLVGVSEGGNLITTNNSVAIMSDTAQSHVTESPDFFDASDANIPYWTEEGSWQTFVLALDPTAAGTNMAMDFYTSGGFLLGTWNGPPGGIPDLAPRDLDFTRVADAVPAAAGGFGHADITSPDRGFMGWIVGLNFTSFQAFMYPIPLRDNDISQLAAGDRP